jgi:ABC-2 type transport system permease protein
MSASAAATADERQVPSLGGLNRTMLGLEVRRLLRNRRTLIFMLIFPSAIFLIFGLSSRHQTLDGKSAPAYVMISLAVYGAMIGTTAGGAAVAVERSQGWSRQLRLTPLRPFAYVISKVLTAMVLGLVAVLVIFAVGAVIGTRVPAHVWLLAGLAAWLGSLVFAAFGLFIGFLVPSENVMQIVGPVLGILAFFGGLFEPLQFLPHAMQTIAKFTPVYGVGETARAPLVGGFQTVALLNVLGWTLFFVIAAMLLFRRDTARV